MNQYSKLFISVLFSFICVTTLFAQDKKKNFTLPEIPSTIQTVNERASFLATHYWDNFSFTDSLQFMNQPDEIEQAVVDYIDIFRLIPLEEAEKSISDLMDKSSVTLNGFLFFYNTFERYLYDVSSPMRNEQYFIPVLEKLIASKKLSEDDKIRPTMLLTSANKNRIGTTAADFKYTKADGSQILLSESPTEWTILIFFDPECDVCHMAIQELEKDTMLGQLIEEKQLSIVAVYPGPKSSMWKTMQGAMSKNWEIGYDKEDAVYSKELYDLLGFPTIYLLDKDKKVLQKDSSPKKIHDFFKKD